MKENLNIDELLNSFIDGELTERDATKVKRLVAHDRKVAQRLRLGRRDRHEVVVIRHDGPCLKVPAELLGRCQQGIVHQVQAPGVTEMVHLPVGPGRNHVGTRVGKSMDGCVWPIGHLVVSPCFVWEHIGCGLLPQAGK